MFWAQFGKRRPNGGRAPCSHGREAIRGLRRLAVLLLAGPLLMPAVLATWGPGGLALAAAARQEANPVETDVMVEDEILAINVRGARLDDVLRAIAEQAGIRLKLTGDLGHPTTAWFAVRLEEGVRHLVGDNGLIMIYEPVRSQAGQHSLAEIWVRGSLDGPVVTFSPAANGDALDRLYYGLDRFDREGKLRAVRELVGLDDATATADLALVLSREPDPKVRRAAAIGLGDNASPEALDALSAALGDRDRSVRFHAIHGLAKIGGRESAAALTTTLWERDPAVRLQSVLALQRIGDVGTVGALAKVLGEDPDPRVRRVTVPTLERIGGAEAWWALFDATADTDPRVREAAAAAITP